MESYKNSVKLNLVWLRENVLIPTGIKDILLNHLSNL